MLCTDAAAKAKKVETLVHVFLYHISTGSRKHLLLRRTYLVGFEPTASA
jgi:hypothetical protein